ncbi:hypothetical protein FEM48_Zijuj02G0065300 [Ziziphus jujuba var. spinosa]|uniref:SHSP domain-containing protein n=1 Tax=Ziziphus jujuba var. spinosa TaxID=714518 RepID=A0A978VU67_ZIZJJ|nr:hypothetical protein FEM48_Zijuj02G0065300 [Ziziphus jujuba var. spinosa]
MARQAIPELDCLCKLGKHSIVRQERNCRDGMGISQQPTAFLWVVRPIQFPIQAGLRYCLKGSIGKFQKRFKLPENALMEEVKASMENGVLTVIVPKVEIEKEILNTDDEEGNTGGHGRQLMQFHVHIIVIINEAKISGRGDISAYTYKGGKVSVMDDRGISPKSTNIARIAKNLWEFQSCGGKRWKHRGKADYRWRFWMEISTSSQIWLSDFG